MSKPTKEQEQKFWEWCGWGDAPGLGLISPEGDDYVPPIDLNFLFKYAVPRAVERIRETQDNCRVDFAWNLLFSWWMRNLINNDFKDPALALFWAICKVMELEK